MSVGPRLRFEVFTRDGFRCRYCGRSADDGAVLHADHIHPRSKGGTDTLDNLVTACFDCNNGKSDRVLRPVPKRRHRPRFVSIAPEVEEPEVIYPPGSHCVTPLRIAAVGSILGYRTYAQAHRRVAELMPGMELPPMRRTDAAWYRVVDNDPYHRRSVMDALNEKITAA